MEHYYTKNPTSKHDEKPFTYDIHDVCLELITDSGVFSKGKIDYGSDVMIKSLPKLSGHILDLGCGYGVIGISLAKLNPHSQVDLVDINERAVELTKRNIALNNIKNALVYQSDGFTNVKSKYNYIISNPPIRAGKKVIYTLFEQSFEFLLPGGSIYLVIQKKQGAPSAENKLNSIFGNCQIVNRKGGYWILKSTKPE